MERVRTVASWLIRHASGIFYLAGLLVSASFFPALLALSREASPLDYGIGLVAGLLVFVIARAAWMRARLWRAEARIRERLTSDSSPFDPMAERLEGKRILLSDLVAPGGRLVRNKRFIECEIVGPGSIVILLQSEGRPPSLFRNPSIENVAYIQVTRSPITAVEFWDCDFDGCHFLNLNLLFFARNFESDYWITPLPVPPLALEDKSG